MLKYKIEIRKKQTFKKIKKRLDKLNIMFVKNEEKVAYYYENINKKIAFSFNESITFYAASTIKILVLLYIYNNKMHLEKEITITEEDIKQGNGVLKDELDLPKKYTLKELLMYTIKYSDNTAYLKLVDFIGKEKLLTYAHNLGAEHTFEGKDNFGITNCLDMLKYWSRLWEILKENPEIEDWLLNPEYAIIKSKNIKSGHFYKKYGAFDIAFHECGVVDGKDPYFLFILTQKGENKKSKRFINKTAKKIEKIHKEVSKLEKKE